MVSEEKKRLESSLISDHHLWKKWGPYVSERAWGTVREDYSPDGKAWAYLTHDMARSKAYRWSEDGLAGVCDRFQMLTFSLALWNGKDPILKERLFGLNPFEGNHGEDVKEYYFYLDSTPTHSYMKFLYKYPHAAFPYDKLTQENKKRGTFDREYELIDTGVFEENRYFDVFVEYAKNRPTDIGIRIEIFNRGPESAEIHLIPQLLFRNRWAWKSKLDSIPEIKVGPSSPNTLSLFADPSKLPPIGAIPYEYKKDLMTLYGEEGGKLLFTNNETNNELLYKTKNRTPYTKDAFHRHIIHHEPCVNQEQIGTKAGIHYQEVIPSGKSRVFFFRLTTEEVEDPLKDVPSIVQMRKQEADEFYKEIQPSHLSEEDKQIQRQAFAGMLWSKQFYHYIVNKWLEGDNPQDPPPEGHKEVRNMHWRHLLAKSVISMPDKWEYPWFASWDLSFHAVATAYVDIQFAKEQLALLLTPEYQHPNGQIPAYEWAFSDLNPPTQAWALWRLYNIDQKQDRDFLERSFLNLMRNFNWWVNKVDKEGNNFFEGGFLGLDNISVIDRSKTLPGGGQFEESDGTGWMGFFALMMVRIALELAKTKPLFEELAIVYFKHFVYISHALQNSKTLSLKMWNDDDGFFYDIVSYPDGNHTSLKIRSFVGIIPFYSLDFYEDADLSQFPQFYSHFHLFIKERPDLCKSCIIPLSQTRYLFSLMNLSQIKQTFARMWDKDEFFSNYGLRSLSQYHEKHPFTFDHNTVGYEPGESIERIKGGNSNWRGPIWIPTNFLVLDSLIKLKKALGDSPQIDGQHFDLNKLSQTLRNRLIDLFRQDPQKRRPVHGDIDLFQKDPYWKDLLLFYEHYHGDTGRGLGASHQTGWSGLIATLIAEL
jgi:hypothetical protein